MPDCCKSASRRRSGAPARARPTVGATHPVGGWGVLDAIPLSRGSFHRHLFFWRQRRLQCLESSLKRVVIVNNKQQQQYTFLCISLQEKESPKSITFNVADNSRFLFLIRQL